MPGNILFLTFGFRIEFIAMTSNFQESSSDNELDVECTQNEKELLDYVLDEYRNEKELLDYVLDEHRNGVFELINIIATKLDQIHGQEGYGEKIIKDCLEEFDQVIEERQKKK